MSLKGCVSLLVVELAQGGSATNRATQSSIYFFLAQTVFLRVTSLVLTSDREKKTVSVLAHSFG